MNFYYWDSTCNGQSFKAQKPMRKKNWLCINSINNYLQDILIYIIILILTLQVISYINVTIIKRGDRMSIYLKDILSSIKELDKDAMEMSQKRWNSIAKPLTV